MRLQRYVALAAMLAAICSWTCGSRSVTAEEIQFVSVTAFADMQQRLDDMEYQLAAFENMGDGKTDCGCDAKGGTVDVCGTCTSPGLTADLELLFLRPFGGDDGERNTNRQYNAAARLTGGWVRDDGLGAQVRWFTYGSDAAEVDAYYLDFELTDKIQLGCWDGNLAGGLRYGHFNDGNSPSRFYGWGPEVGVSMARHLRGNLYLVGSGRYSILFGQDKEYDEDETTSITELQLATEYRRDLGGTAQWFGRIGFDAQYWSALASDDEEDFGLVGVAFALGITR